MRFHKTFKKQFTNRMQLCIIESYYTKKGDTTMEIVSKNNLETIRKLNGLTRNDVAKHLNVVYNTVAKYERAENIKTVISIDTAEKLAKLLKVPVEVITGDKQLNVKIKKAR